MKKTYLNKVDFHIATENDRKEIKQKQRVLAEKCFWKRAAVVFLIVMIGTVFQLLARKSVPNVFSVRWTKERLYIMATGIWLAVNLLSFLELMIENKVLFNVKRAEIAKLKVVKKVITHQFDYFAIAQRGIVCEFGSDFLSETIEVKGIFKFGSIKEGDEVYVERIRDEGHHLFFYVA